MDINIKDVGPLTQSFSTDVPADVNSDVFIQYDKTIPKFPNQAIYIYSFAEKKMIYANGWDNLLGYKDDEITMLKIVSSTTSRHMKFSNELNERSLEFLSTKKEKLEEYSFTLEVEKTHKNGDIVPLFSRVAIHKAINGQIAEIIGISQVMPNLKFGDVMQYAGYGPGNEEFEEILSKGLFEHTAISRKEKEALALVAEGHAYKEVANILSVSQSAIEKRIRPMFKRFNVNSLTHLVSFAKDNYIL